MGVTGENYFCEILIWVYCHFAKTKCLCMATAKLLRHLRCLSLDRRMAKLRKLKALMFFIFFVSLASLIAMFSYTVNFAQHMKSGRTPVVLLINDTQWNRLLQEMSFSGSEDEGWNNELTYHSSVESVGRNRDQREQNNQNRSKINIPNYGSVTENRRNYIRGLCPQKSPALNKFRVFQFFDYIMSPRLEVRSMEEICCSYFEYFID